MLPLGLVLLAGALVLYRQVAANSSVITYVKNSESTFLITNLINKNIISSLKDNTCFDGSNFRDLSLASSAEVSFSAIDRIKECLAPTDLDVLETARISIDRLIGEEDQKLGGSSLKVSHLLRTRGALGSPVKELLEARIINYRLANLADFALVFRGGGGTRVELTEGSELKVMGRVYVHGNERFSLSTFVSPSLLSQDAAVTFGDNFLLQQLSAEADSVFDIDVIKSRFRQGLQFGELRSLNPFPVDENPLAWNQSIDYHYVYKTGGLPLPSDISSAHGSVDRPVDTGKASVLTFPNSLVIDDLLETCVSPLSKLSAMVLYRAQSNVTINLQDSPAFCGMAVADTLVVNTKPGTTHLLIGSFWLNKLKVTGGGQLIVYNPLLARETPESILSLAGVDSAKVAIQLLTLRATTAYNFFLPLFKDKTGIAGFSPVKLSSFFEPCGSQMCWPAVMEFPKWSTLYSQAGWQDKVIFLVEEGL